MFKFKKFTVRQDKCAMKVGTDGVLLGAWAPLWHQPETILDIGTGSGVIALMLAQRSDAPQIDALEIDADAYEQAVGNFDDSPWADRLFCYHAGLDELADEPDVQYDLIVSNPPFHTEDYPSPDTRRSTARFSGSLPLDELLKESALLLSEKGVLAVIIPTKSEAEFLSLAREKGLFPNRVTHVRGTPDSPVKRSLISLSRTPSAIETSELVIETARHKYTPEYIALTKEFYLNM